MSEPGGILGLILRLVGAAGKASKSTQPAPQRQPARRAGRVTGARRISPPVKEPAQSRATGDPSTSIRKIVQDWQGVPYKMGGTSRSGIDCSGFVRYMYGDGLGCKLPRSTSEQVHEGTPVSRSDLAPGDLVFFRISERTRHVGAYLGNGEFGHASSSRGPMVSRLDSEYWDQRYWTARRVL